MNDNSQDISTEIVFIENAILDPYDYNANAINNRIDKVFELVIKKSEIANGKSKNYISEFLSWRRKMKTITKEQSKKLKEILQITDKIIKDSKRVLEGEMSLKNHRTFNKRIELLAKEYIASFEEFKLLIPEGAAVQYKKELADIHEKHQVKFMTSSFMKNALFTILKFLSFLISFYFATKIDEQTESVIKHPLTLFQKLFVSGTLYFTFEKFLDKLKTELEWTIVAKSFEDLKILVNLVYTKDQSIMQAYIGQIEKVKNEYYSALDTIKSVTKNT